MEEETCIAEGLLKLSDEFYKKKNILQAIKCLESIFQNEISILSLMEVKIRIKLSFILLQHTTNVLQAKMHLDRVQILFTRIKGWFSLRCFTFNLLIRCYFIMNSKNLHFQMMSKAMEFVIANKESPSAQIWACNFLLQIANFQITESQSQSQNLGQSQNKNETESQMKLCIHSLQQGLKWIESNNCNPLKILFLSCMNHIHIINNEKHSLIEPLFDEINTIMTKMNKKEIKNNKPILIYYYIINCLWCINTCDYKKLSQNIKILEEKTNYDYNSFNLKKKSTNLKNTNLISDDNNNDEKVNSNVNIGSHNNNRKNEKIMNNVNCKKNENEDDEQEVEDSNDDDDDDNDGDDGEVQVVEVIEEEDIDDDDDDDDDDDVRKLHAKKRIKNEMNFSFKNNVKSMNGKFDKKVKIKKESNRVKKEEEDEVQVVLVDDEAEEGGGERDEEEDKEEEEEEEEEKEEEEVKEEENEGTIEEKKEKRNDNGEENNQNNQNKRKRKIEKKKKRKEKERKKKKRIIGENIFHEFIPFYSSTENNNNNNNNNNDNNNNNNNDNDDNIYNFNFLNGFFLPINCIHCFIDLFYIINSKANGNYEAIDERMISSIQKIENDLSIIGLTDESNEDDIPKYSIWNVNIYIQLYFYFLENKCLILLTKCEFLASQKIILKLINLKKKFPKILKNFDSKIYLILGHYFFSLNFLNVANSFYNKSIESSVNEKEEFISIFHLSLTLLLQHQSPALPSPSLPSLPSLPSSPSPSPSPSSSSSALSQVLDLLNPYIVESNNLFDSKLGIKEKILFFFIHGFLYFNQKKYFDARTQLARGLKLTHNTCRDYQMTVHFLSTIGSMALTDEDLSLAEGSFDSAWNLTEPVKDLNSQLWLSKNLGSRLKLDPKSKDEISTSVCKLEKILNEKIEMAVSSSLHSTLSNASLE